MSRGVGAGSGALARRALALAGAVALGGLVFVAAERARMAPTPLGSALGVTPLEPRLSEIADRIALAHRAPSADDSAFARRAAVAAPLSALPYYIAAARPQHAVAASRALVAQALQRDPRLRPALAWRLADLARSGDVASATRTLLRLAVLTPENQQLWSAVAQISTSPAARAVITRQIQQGAPWRDIYLKALSESPIDRAIVFEMVELAGKHRPITALVPGQPDDRRSFLAALVARKEYERAYLAWVQWLPAKSQAAVGYVYDGDFTGAAALPPFAWQMTDGVGGATAIEPGSGLSLDYSGTDGAVVAQQMLLLAPGRYRLVTQANFAPVSSDTGASTLAWRLTCLPDAKPLSDVGVPLQGSLARADGAPFVVAADCPAQTLTLKVNSAEFAKHVAGKIRSISIEAVQ